MDGKPRFRYLADTCCHFCVLPIRHTVAAREVIRTQDVIFGVCDSHLDFMQNDQRSSYELLAVNGSSAIRQMPDGYQPKVWQPATVQSSPIELLLQG